MPDNKANSDASVVTPAYQENPNATVAFEHGQAPLSGTTTSGAYAAAAASVQSSQATAPVPAPVSYEVGYQQPVAPGYAPAPVTAPVAPMPIPPQPVSPARQPVNGFTVAGLVLAIIAFIFAMWAFGDKVSVFGVVALAMGIIGWFYTKDAASSRGEKPSAFNTAIVVVVIVFALIAIVMTPLAPYILGHRVF